MGAVKKSVRIERLLTKMQGHKTYFDTNILIYVLANVEGYVEVCLPFFSAVALKKIVGCTGEMTIAELLVKPMQDNNMLEIEKIKSLFAEPDYFQTFAHDRATLELAAYIRATQKLKMIDAIHTATAIKGGCKFMLTHDKLMTRNVSGIEVVNIADYL